MSKKSSTFALAFETKHGPLAQLNRVPHYGCGGCRFESCTDHKKEMFDEHLFFVLYLGHPFCIPFVSLRRSGYVVCRMM